MRDSDRAVGTFTATSVQTARVENTSTPIPAVNPTDTLSPTALLTDTPVLPTPALPPDIAEDFFFTGSYPGCQLPCWQGLVVGESGRDDIQAFFDTVLGFHGTREFGPESAPELEYDLWPPDIRASGYAWAVPVAETVQGFGVNVYYEHDTFILRAIEVSSGYHLYNATLPPQRIVEELGMPGDFMMGLVGTERGDVVRLRILMAYSEGIIFDIGEVFTPITLSISENHAGGAYELCLGGERWNQEYATGHWHIYIFEPWEGGPENLAPLQEDLITLGSAPTPSLTDLMPVQDFFNVSSEELAAILLQEDDACLSTNEFPW